MPFGSTVRAAGGPAPQPPSKASTAARVAGACTGSASTSPGRAHSSAQCTASSSLGRIGSAPSGKPALRSAAWMRRGISPRVATAQIRLVFLNDDEVRVELRHGTCQGLDLTVLAVASLTQDGAEAPARAAQIIGHAQQTLHAIRVVRVVHQDAYPVALEAHHAAEVVSDLRAKAREHRGDDRRGIPSAPPASAAAARLAML